MIGLELLQRLFSEGKVSRREFIAQAAALGATAALSLARSTSALERPCNTIHQQRNLKPVLQRPIETAGQCCLSNNKR